MISRIQMFKANYIRRMERESEKSSFSRQKQKKKKSEKESNITTTTTRTKSAKSKVWTKITKEDEKHKKDNVHLN